MKIETTPVIVFTMTLFFVNVGSGIHIRRIWILKIPDIVSNVTQVDVHQSSVDAIKTYKISYISGSQTASVTKMHAY